MKPKKKTSENVNPLPDFIPPRTPPKEPPLCYSCHKHGHHANSCGAKASRPREINHHPDRSLRHGDGGDSD